MKNLIKIAWRNLWRNKRRSIITIASIVFALFFALIMRSFQEGSYNNMINNVVNSYSGYLQIQNKNYNKNKTIDNTFEFTDSLKNIIAGTKSITGYVPRLESFALASTDKKTKGALVIGSEYKREDEMTHISKKIIKGKYFNKDDQGVLIAEKLAGYLNLTVGDSVVLLSQGYHGMSAAGLFPIIGIVRIPNPKLNNVMIYMPLPKAQDFYSAYNMLSSCVINVDNKNMKSVQKALLSKLKDSDNTVLNWKEMLPELVQQIESDRSGGILMLAILYLIIGFGIFGTVIMMVAERRHEMAVLIAIGMQKTKLNIILLFETMFLGLTGIIVGSIISTPIIWYLIVHPIRLTGDAAKAIENFGVEAIMPAMFDYHIFLNQAIIVFVMVLVAFMYPVFNISKLRVINALRS